MPFPEQVDLDKLMGIILDCEKKAISGWLAGVPRDEPAFMNRLTGELTRARRGCDVGLTERIVARAVVSELHRKARDASDLFGNDLGITVCIEPGDYTRTALFQVKVGAGFSATLERHQLEATTVSTELKERGFVLYLDEQRGTIKIAKAAELLKGWLPGQAWKTVSTAKWKPVSEWVSGWLSCDIGPMSEPSDPGSLEMRLQQYEVDTQPAVAGAQEPADELAWLRFALLPEGVDVSGSPFARIFRGRRR